MVFLCALRGALRRSSLSSRACPLSSSLPVAPGPPTRNLDIKNVFAIFFIPLPQLPSLFLLPAFVGSYLYEPFSCSALGRFFSAGVCAAAQLPFSFFLCSLCFPLHWLSTMDGVWWRPEPCRCLSLLSTMGGVWWRPEPCRCLSLLAFYLFCCFSRCCHLSTAFPRRTVAFPATPVTECLCARCLGSLSLRRDFPYLWSLVAILEFGLRGSSTFLDLGVRGISLVFYAVCCMLRAAYSDVATCKL